MIDLVNILQKDSSILLYWFSCNDINLNAAKSNLVVNNKENISIKVDDKIIIGKKSDKLLGITIDNEIDFSEHINMISKKASQKLHALARIVKYMSFDKLIINAFIVSQFNYCPLVWMFVEP